MLVQERIWRGQGKSYHRVLPEALALTQRSCTAELQRVITDFGLDHSFAKGAKKLREHYGFDLPVSSIRNYTECNAKRIAEESAQQESDSNRLPADGVEKLIGETDGSMIAFVHFKGTKADTRKNRKVEYREVRLCATQASGSERTIYRAGIDSPEKIGQLWKCCAKEAGRGVNSFVHTVGDGATWIEQQARNELGADRVLLDFYHLCEYLKAAEQSCSGNSRWFATQKNRLKRNRSDLVIEELTSHLEPEHLPDCDAPVRCAHRYMTNRPDQLDYQGTIKQELPIGSGLIESGHKHVIQARMKIAGAAWDKENAQAIIKTRARRESGVWEEFWNN